MIDGQGTPSVQGCCMHSVGGLITHMNCAALITHMFLI
jgi:hypothetical protein